MAFSVCEARPADLARAVLCLDELSKDVKGELILVDAERDGASVVCRGVMPGGMRFAYLSAEQAGIPYLEVTHIPSEIRAFFDYVKQEQV